MPMATFASSTGNLRSRYNTSKPSSRPISGATMSYSGLPSSRKTDTFTQYSHQTQVNGLLPTAHRPYYSPQLVRKFGQDYSSPYKYKSIVSDQPIRDSRRVAADIEGLSAASTNASSERRLPRQAQRATSSRPRSSSLDRGLAENRGRHELAEDRTGHDLTYRRHSAVGVDDLGGITSVRKSSLKSARPGYDKHSAARTVRFATSSNASIGATSESPTSTAGVVTPAITTATSLSGGRAAAVKAATSVLDTTGTTGRLTLDTKTSFSDRASQRAGAGSDKTSSSIADFTSTAPSNKLSIAMSSNPNDSIGKSSLRYPEIGRGDSACGTLTPRPSISLQGSISDRMRGNGLVGLHNLGNTCFMNSIIQCLSHTKPLRQALLSELRKGKMANEFTKLLKKLWQGSGDSVAPMEFKSEVQRVAPRFVGYQQQDAQELLHAVFEGLHNELNRVTRKPPNYFDADSVRHLSCSDQAYEALKAYLAREDSLLTDLFVGQLRSTLTCGECNHRSYTFDPFWDLSLPIPQAAKSTVSSGRIFPKRATSYDNLGLNGGYDSISNVTLEECFAHFNREELLDGQEKAYCDHCGKRQPSRKKFSIQRLPEILVLHLKRFSSSSLRRKLSTLVRFHDTIHLSSHISDTETKYSLYAVSNHSGGPYAGHYTACCRAGNGHWYSFNDRVVSPISFSSVCSSQAYVLFYQKDPNSSKTTLVESRI